MDLRVAAYGVVTDDDGRMLLARWVEGRRVAWTLPGGGLENGEDPELAVRRELREETGFRIETTQLLGIHSRVIPASRRVRRDENKVPLHTLRIVYRAEITGGELRFEKNGSTDMAAWFTLDEVAGLQRVKLVDIGLRMAGLLPTPAAQSRGCSGSEMSATTAPYARIRSSASVNRLYPCVPAPMAMRRPTMVSSAYTGQSRVLPIGTIVPRS